MAIDLQDYVIGVTGSMGCGKSHTCRALVNLCHAQGLQATHVDYDVIRRSSKAPLDQLEATINANSGIRLVEWAMLVEDGFVPRFARDVLLVTSSYEKQLERLTGGDLPLNEVNRRISAQLSNEEKKLALTRILPTHGRIFTFDTTTNPGTASYHDLLKQIIPEAYHVR